jgi:hypothetical protein
MTMAYRPELTSRERGGGRFETDRLLEAVREAAQSMRFGHILIKVQDGRVVQVEKTEKVRYE